MKHPRATDGCGSGRVDEDGGDDHDDAFGDSHYDRDQEKQYLLDKLEIAEQKLAEQSMLQLTRETDLRCEISSEMAVRGDHMLTQMQQLQDEIYSLKNSRNTFQMSAKKAKRQQRYKENDDVANALSSTEEELEEVKRSYEIQIVSLKFEIDQLKSEVSEWKAKALQTSSLSLMGPASLSSSHVLSDMAGTGVADSFDQRMPKRFQNNSSSSNSSSSNSGNQSVVRAPLSPIKSAQNSPNISPDNSVESIKIITVKTESTNNNSSNNSSNNNFRKKLLAGAVSSGFGNENMVIEQGAPIAPPRQHGGVSSPTVSGGTFFRTLRSARIN